MQADHLARPTVQRDIALLREGARRGVHVTGRVREDVQASWARSRTSGVSPALGAAPVALEAQALADAIEETEWLTAAHQAVAQRSAGFDYRGHVVALFDGQGRFLAGDGDPAACDALRGINFAPGALWAEAAVGTNGPGTALATGAPVHIVGTEHYCDAWQAWHCAAVPIRDPRDGRLLGVLDISGEAAHASPHALQLAGALGLAVEQAMLVLEARRDLELMRAFTVASTRHPTEAMLVCDRRGRIVHATPQVPGMLRVGGTPGAALLSALRDVARGRGEREVPLPVTDDVALHAVARPVESEGRLIGSTLQLLAVPSDETAAFTPRARPSVRPRVAQGTRFTFADIVGRSPALREALTVAHASARNAMPVLILGESGTGKEVVAQAIHADSARAERPFVAVNCAAIPRELIEAELFGYVGGAFSGARREGHAGKFEAAHGGTLFLDEIGELTPASQAALLRVLQEGEIVRVGGTAPQRVDVRVIAATNRDPVSAIAQGALREDLFYRLNVLSLELPPLRARREDVPALVAAFLGQAAMELGAAPFQLDVDAVLAMQAWHWPGNVRELKNLIRRLAAMALGTRITRAELPVAMRTGQMPAPPAPAAVPLMPASRARPHAWRPAREASEAALPPEQQLRAVIAAAPTMQEAARRLGITRSTLYRRMEALGLRPGRVAR